MDYDSYLAHHGIKGMKWGVRRDVGSDGTVGSGSGKTKTNKSKMSDSTKAEQTAKKAKKKGVGSVSNEELKDVQTRKNLEKNANLESGGRRSTTSTDASRAKKLERAVSSNGVGNLSNDELQTVISRMELQNKYSNLKKNNSKVETGKSLVKEVLLTAASNVATSLVEEAMRGAARGAGNTARNRYSSRRSDQTSVSAGRQRELPPGRR